MCGFVSETKLASVMGMHVLALRTWLAERNIQMPSVYADTDVKHA